MKKCSNHDTFASGDFVVGTKIPKSKVTYTGMKSTKCKKTLRQILKEIEDLEPTNMTDYIFRGSGVVQWMKLNGFDDTPKGRKGK